MLKPFLSVLSDRVLVCDGTIEVIDKGRSRGARPLEPAEAERLGALAESAAGAGAGHEQPTPISDDMRADIQIDALRLTVRTGDGSPPEVWELLAELGRASRTP